MKRLLLALTILAAGTSVFCAFHNSAAQFRSASTGRREAWLAQTQRLTRAQTQHAELTARIRDLKRSLLNQPRGVAESALVNVIATNATLQSLPEVRERLLAELGFNWNSTGDYLVVSKDSLRKLRLEAVRDHRLTDTVCSVLAITPAERAAIEAVLERLAAEFKTRAVSHVQRAEPQGDVLAKYTLPFDPDFSQSLSNTFSASLFAALGLERGELLLGYGSSWMHDLGMRGNGPTILTIKRAPAGQERLPFELKTPDGGTMYAAVSPHQPFPEAFRQIFPGGWTELAKYEGFELPKEFQKK